MICGSLLNRRCHSRALMITTSSRPMVNSSGWKNRPLIGETPSSGNTPAVTVAPAIRSGRSSPARLKSV